MVALLESLFLRPVHFAPKIGLGRQRGRGGAGDRGIRSGRSEHCLHLFLPGVVSTATSTKKGWARLPPPLTGLTPTLSRRNPLRPASHLTLLKFSSRGVCTWRRGTPGCGVGQAESRSQAFILATGGRVAPESPTRPWVPGPSDCSTGDLRHPLSSLAITDLPLRLSAPLTHRTSLPPTCTPLCAARASAARLCGFARTVARVRVLSVLSM